MNQRIIAILVLIGTPILMWVTYLLERFNSWVYLKYLRWKDVDCYTHPTDGTCNFPTLSYLLEKKRNGTLTSMDYKRAAAYDRSILKDKYKTDEDRKIVLLNYNK